MRKHLLVFVLLSLLFFNLGASTSQFHWNQPEHEGRLEVILKHPSIPDEFNSSIPFHYPNIFETSLTCKEAVCDAEGEDLSLYLMDIDQDENTEYGISYTGFSKGYEPYNKEKYFDKRQNSTFTESGDLLVNGPHLKGIDSSLSLIPLSRRLDVFTLSWNWDENRDGSFDETDTHSCPYLIRFRNWPKKVYSSSRSPSGTYTLYNGTFQKDWIDSFGNSSEPPTNLALTGSNKTAVISFPEIHKLSDAAYFINNAESHGKILTICTNRTKFNLSASEGPNLFVYRSNIEKRLSPGEFSYRLFHLGNLSLSESKTRFLENYTDASIKVDNRVLNDLKEINLQFSIASNEERFENYTISYPTKSGTENVTYNQVGRINFEETVRVTEQNPLLYPLTEKQAILTINHSPYPNSSERLEIRDSDYKGKLVGKKEKIILTIFVPRQVKIMHLFYILPSLLFSLVYISSLFWPEESKTYKNTISKPGTVFSFLSITYGIFVALWGTNSIFSLIGITVNISFWISIAILLYREFIQNRESIFITD